MASSIINSDDGVSSGSTGLKTTGGDDGVLKLQTNGVDAVTVDSSQVVNFANQFTVGGSPVASGGDYIVRTYNSPATWTKPANLKAVRITMIGAGGGGGGTTGANPDFITKTAGRGGNARDLSLGYLSAPSIPGPVTVTVGAGGAGGTTSGTNGSSGGTTSFGPFMSMTGGGGGGGVATPVGTSGTGANGVPGGLATGPAVIYVSQGVVSPGNRVSPTDNTLAVLTTGVLSGIGGAPRNYRPSPAAVLPALNGAGYGGGGYGGFTIFNSDSIPVPIQPTMDNADAGGTGQPGYIIVEEFY